VRESGVARFDVSRQLDNPTCFVLVEVYWSSVAPTEHKKTAHYQTWRDTVAEMMAEPRSSVKYDNIFPDNQRWG
jgi:autoinducer 2-degrading protein